MFGYVRPAKPELKVKQWEDYNAVYCGLCHTLKRRYGLISRFFLNYDFVFLAMLLLPPQEKPTIEHRRCFACPHRKKCVLTQQDGLDVAADESVILTYHQLRDAASDSGVLKGIGARGLSLMLYPSYRKAVKYRPEFDLVVRENLKRLVELEKNQCDSLDLPADTFAEILAAAAPKSGDAPKDRVLRQLLYHVGRWIYLVDARDDLEKDRKEGNYNPLPLRWPDGPEHHDQELRHTMEGSLDLAISAFYLMDSGCWEPILGNILCIGLPVIEEAVFRGMWKKKNKKTAGDDV